MPEREVEPVRPPRSGASGLRTWTITGAITVVLLGAMYGVTAHRVEVQDEHRQVEMQKDAATPAPGLTQPAN